jgi:hypothetical protein
LGALKSIYFREEQSIGVARSYDEAPTTQVLLSLCILVLFLFSFCK